MAKKEKKQSSVFVGTSRKDLFMIDPNHIEIVTDPEHPLYDPRAELEPPETLILNIMKNGILNNVVVVNDGGKAVVVSGRQRVRAAREANTRLAKTGGKLLKVPCTRRVGSQEDMYGLIISENEHRRDDDALEKAEKYVHYVTMGGTDDDAMVDFGVSKATISAWKKIVDLSAVVKKAIKQEKISVSAAAKLAKLSNEDQKTKLAELLEQSGGKKVSTSKAAEKVPSKNPKAKLRPAKDIEEILTLLDPDNNYLEDFLKWLLCKEDEINWEQYGIEVEEEGPEESEEEETEEIEETEDIDEDENDDLLGDED
jgi:ParB family chromosome partitioning protein